MRSVPAGVLEPTSLSAANETDCANPVEPALAPDALVAVSKSTSLPFPTLAACLRAYLTPEPHFQGTAL